MKHVKKVLSYSIVGSIGLTLAASLQGCSDQGVPPQGNRGFGSPQEGAQEQNWFLVIAQTGTYPDTYQVVEKHPTTGPTRAILRDMQGNERFLSEDELRMIAEEEAARVEAGTSQLTQDPAMTAGGLSLGETILAAAAGSLIGGMLANSLARNRNFQSYQQRYGGGRPPAAISQPYRSAGAGKQPKSGYFGGNRGGTGYPSRSYGSYGG